MEEANKNKKMSTLKTWRDDELEEINICPCCDQRLNKKQYITSKDWAFGVAEGNWTHVECESCNSLVLTPRPKRQFISRAYQSYYTHSRKKSLLEVFKDQIINAHLENISGHLFEPSIKPNLLIKLIAKLISKKIYISQDWLYILQNIKKGKMIDLGCGSGRVVKLAQNAGWNSHGIESDPRAVENSRKNGISISLGNVEDISVYKDEFDLVYCSHVLEHLYEQKNFLLNIYEALKIGGALIIITPNSESTLRHYYGKYWRGLEAPRHICIPSKEKIKSILESIGFKIDDFSDGRLETLEESEKFRVNFNEDKNSDDSSIKFLRRNANRIRNHIKINDSQCDITKLICIK